MTTLWKEGEKTTTTKTMNNEGKQQQRDVSNDYNEQVATILTNKLETATTWQLIFICQKKHSNETFQLKFDLFILIYLTLDVGF